MKQNRKFDYMHVYAKYFGLMIQMILLVLIGGFVGRYLDNYFGITNSLLTILLIVFSSILAFYLFFKTIFK